MRSSRGIPWNACPTVASPSRREVTVSTLLIFPIDSAQRRTMSAHSCGDRQKTKIRCLELPSPPSAPSAHAAAPSATRCSATAVMPDAVSWRCNAVLRNSSCRPASETSRI
eukprot:CAMPEP_0172763212 /NCGR_PEP_ID=MMETSP1074-20121228/174907_1 /TAXON_ID=2916 /ORGANISM="Ceratium fusus, Strain PA161109" /LENGTH=110 /DNA_ID=CAMNT_0013597749 /DNA_START=63 /DNA_END=395 /DNA_ORIENTATION=-